MNPGQEEPSEGKASAPVQPFTAADSDFNVQISKTVTDEVASQATAYTNRILRYIVAVVIGAVLASVWNLNGQIYQAVGATSVSTKALELEIERLKLELAKQQIRVKIQECLENKLVLDKAGCYRVT